MQHDDMRTLINLCEGLETHADPIVAGKLNGREITLETGAIVELYNADNSETDSDNMPMVTYRVAHDDNETAITATYYASDKTWLVLSDGSDFENGELSGSKLTPLLNQVPEFAEQGEEDDGYDLDTHPSLTPAERNQ